MSVKVRYAPSPTGHLHLGGARTALYCYLYARSQQGKFILRIEDTDTARGGKQYEKSQIQDLAWLGIQHDEGPYRQSERLHFYKETADKLIKEGRAYPCFLTQEELDDLTKKAKAENKAPHAYHNQCAHLSRHEAQEKIQSGQTYVIRFKNPKRQTWSICDRVRGEVTWEGESVGDFVIMRSNGIPVYNFCCAVDDILMEITHVIRADDHLNNTLRQLMIYDALGKKPPEFAHCSLIVGHDRQKLSKRHGAMSVASYRKEHYLPQAITNYIYLLGQTHPKEKKDVFNVYSNSVDFSLDKLSKAPATYDILKLNNINGHHMRMLSAKNLVDYISQCALDHEHFSLQNQSWKEKFCQFFSPRINLPSEIIPHIESIFDNKVENSEEYKSIVEGQLGQEVKEYFKEQLSLVDTPFLTQSQIKTWIENCQKKMGIKGKALFRTVRAILTGKTQGSDLKTLISLMPVKILKHRLSISKKRPAKEKLFMVKN